MILRRNKKKLKKAKKLQEEAQLVAKPKLRSLSLPHGTGGDGLLPHVTNSFDKDYEFVGTSGSDPDTEVVDSLSLTFSEPPALSAPVPVQPARTLHHHHHHDYSNIKNSPPHQNQFSAATSATGTTNSQTKDAQQMLKRMGLSQPLITSIPEDPTNSVSTKPQIQQSVRPQSIVSASGTLQRVKKTSLTNEQSQFIASAVSLGLGRGIDATNKKPWLNKKSFQVRRVHTSVMETNEGGILMCYNHEVPSNIDMEESFVASLTPPEANVSIYIEDELDRNSSSTRRIVGRKVISRTIGFQADFEEKYPDGSTTKLSRESIVVPKDPAEIVFNTQISAHTFEERVCLWLLHKLAHKAGTINLIGQKSDENPVDYLAKIIRSKPSSNLENEIKNSCEELIQSLQLTHYVTLIQLGASEYHVMSGGQYQKKMASEGAFGVDRFADIFSSQPQSDKSKKEAKKYSQLRHVGKIENDRVAKEGEVVLKVQVQPITRLIKLPILKSFLSNALEKYMEHSQGGPFVIKCTGRDLYLTVNKYNDYEVEGTDTPTEASLFYFQTTDDGNNPFEFHIAYYGEDVDPNDDEESSSISRYLEAPFNFRGQCPGPLLMKHSVKVKNTRFTLRSRLSKKNNKSHLEEWIAGEDAFYIACATKTYQHGSYLAVKHIKSTRDLIGKHFFMTCCVPSIHNHNGETAFMLFQLCPKQTITSKRCGRETPGKLQIPTE